MHHSIELKDLLTYSSIYGLGLTTADVSHLQFMAASYDNQIDATYIYKPTSRSYDLTLVFRISNSSTKYVTVNKTDPMAAQKGYPLFAIDSHFYFVTPPRISDLPLLRCLTEGIDKSEQAEYFNTVDEFKKTFLIRDLHKLRHRYNLDQEFIKACFWALDKESEYNPDLIDTEKHKKDYKEMPAYVKHIIAVLQMPQDIRLAFYVNKEEYSNWNNTTFYLGIDYYTTAPGDDCYNFTDPDKYFSHLDPETRRPRVVYPDSSSTFPKSKDIIDNYKRGKHFQTIDKTTLDILTQRWARKQQELAEEQSAVKTLEKKIKTKIDELNTGNTFNYNDMSFSKNAITYENQDITDANVDTGLVLKLFAGRYSEEQLNFDTVFEQWTNLVYEQLTKKKKSTGKIGDVNYKLEMHVTKSNRKNGAEVETRNFYINDYRINKEEVVEVLKRALCFPNTEEFSTFCESVAACSLKYHRLLSGGVIINAQDEVFDENLTFRIDLTRTKNKNFIVVGDKTWKVTDTNRLLTLSNARDMTRVISVLLDPETVGMTGEEVKNLLEVGKKSLIEQKQREDELLQTTMKQFNIEKVADMACNNGKMLTGFLIHGKLRDYVVEESHCMVFEYPTGRYICMVDKGQNEHTNTARLVNRFYALSNDSKLAQEITGL